MENGYSLNEVAKLTGLQVRTVREWVHNGKIKAEKLAGSNRWFVTEGEVRRLRNENGN